MNSPSESPESNNNPIWENLSEDIDTDGLTDIDLPRAGNNQLSPELDKPTDIEERIEELFADNSTEESQ